MKRSTSSWTLATEAKVDYFFVGGSLVISSHLDECIQQIKSFCDIPVTVISRFAFTGE
jgi:heptaprenylglyceryl phosphate synthase